MMPTTQNYDRPGYWQQVKESSWGRWIRNLLTAGAGTAFYTIIQSRKNNALAEENPETSAELEFKKFEAKFAPPEEIKELLNNNKEIISKKNFGTINRNKWSTCRNYQRRRQYGVLLMLSDCADVLKKITLDSWLLLKNIIMRERFC